MPSTINVIPDIVKGQLRKNGGTADANLAFQTNGTNAVVIDNNQNANFVSTGAIVLPKGTTAQRPASPVNGMWRYNTSYAYIEVYVNNSWANLTPILVPVNTAAPVVAGSTSVGGVANVTNGTWSGSPTGYYYQWYANSSAISNATANTFTITITQNGSNLSCNVTAYNSLGNAAAPAQSNSVGPVTATYSASYLLVGGGAGAALGGGGAGGMLANTTTLTGGTTYSFVVGGGGGAGGFGNQGGAGTASTALGLTAYGGGGGGPGEGQGGPGSGGSGGGAGGGAQGGGSGTAGQGNNGGSNGTGSNYFGAGGGGAGGGGGTGFFTDSNWYGGAGGSGAQSSITGTATYYAGGGGGNGQAGGAGGAGGGGGRGSSGTANTGGGGGGGNYTSNGGSGLFILSVPTASYSGITTGSPTVTTNGSNTIMTFNSSGSYTA